MFKQEIITRKKFNYLKKYYDKTWDSSRHTLHVGIFNHKKDSLDKAYKQATEHLIENITAIMPISKNSKILDVGCGTGRTLIEICAKHNCRGVGIDLSDEQIKDAQEYLQKINKNHSLQKLPKINVRFIRTSGSNLEKSLEKDRQFTHIISQDAIFLITNKQSFFENVYRLLIPGGIFAAADFLSESGDSKITESEKSLIYKLVNWNESLSLITYQDILKTVGLSVIKTERKDADMIRTYKKLAQKMNPYISLDDKTFTELKERYESIVSAVKNGKMSWGFFFAQKPPRKIALLAGTKPKSIGRFLANFLYKNGWEVWLYSRSAQKINKQNWHERKCDISKKQSIQKLLNEINNINLVMMLADTSNGHDTLEKLSNDSIKGCINAKLIGSVLLSKCLAIKFSKPNKPIKIIWCAGKPSKKPKNLILYSMINSGLVSYINELNDHYKNIFEAYYLPTTLISPSTIGDDYIRKIGKKSRVLAENPKVIAEKLQQILDNKIVPGMINTSKKIL